MNNNAMKSKSTIKVKETATGGLHDSVGFPGFKEEGYVQSLDDQLDAMESNGFDVEETSQGIFITPKIS